MSTESSMRGTVLGNSKAWVEDGKTYHEKKSRQGEVGSVGCAGWIMGNLKGQSEECLRHSVGERDLWEVKKWNDGNWVEWRLIW